MPSDDEIRALCLQALQAQSTDNFEVSLRALRVALNEHFIEAENLGIHLLLKMGKEIPLALEKGDQGPGRKDGTEG